MSRAPAERVLDVLVIDDSARSREAVVGALSGLSGVRVVGVASDGEEGLKRAIALKPDLITVDLEMPRMDGFTFLRMVMARAPAPVLVVSSYARKENIFRALELGAVDFIPKPGGDDSGSPEALRSLLADKVQIVRCLRRSNLRPVPPSLPSASPVPPASPPPPHRTMPTAQAVREAAGRAAPDPARRLRVIAIGASTGGPPALQHLLGTLPADLPAAIVIAQHMPERFTTAFAARLDRGSPLSVREASDGDVLATGEVLLAPGGKQMTVSLRRGVPQVKLAEPAPGDTTIPSVDDLFRSVAALAGPNALALVLTGMGRDGREGIVTLKQAGGLVLAESEATAIVYGMPKEAADTGCVDRVAPLEEISALLLAFGREGRLPGSRRR